MLLGRWWWLFPLQSGRRWPPATWPYLFAINVPFGVAALVIGMRALPHTPRGRHAFDWQSALMIAIMFGLGIAAIDSVGHGAAPLFGAALSTLRLSPAGARAQIARGNQNCVFKQSPGTKHLHRSKITPILKRKQP